MTQMRTTGLISCSSCCTELKHLNQFLVAFFFPPALLSLTTLTNVSLSLCHEHKSQNSSDTLLSQKSWKGNLSLAKRSDAKSYLNTGDVYLIEQREQSVVGGIVVNLWNGPVYLSVTWCWAVPAGVLARLALIMREWVGSPLLLLVMSLRCNFRLAII